MVTRRELLQAVRGGSYVPFADRTTSLDIHSQIEELADSLFLPDLVDTIKFVLKLDDRLPSSLTPKERLFCRCLRQGLINL